MPDLSPNSLKEKNSNMFKSQPVNGSNSIYGRIMQNRIPVGTNPDPYDVDPLPVAELEMEDPLSAEYQYYDEPLAQDKGDESVHLSKTRPLPVPAN